MLYNDFHVEFEIQPKQNFHYRYESEKHMTHGILNGQIDDSYPKVTLNLPANQQNGDYYVLCTLHRYAENNRKIVLSPHLLQHNTEKNLNYDVIFERMQEDPKCPTKKYWEFKNYVIIRLKKTEYKSSIEKKREFYNAKGLPLSFDNLLGDINLENAQSLADCAQPNVCLGVTIFEKNVNDKTYSLIANTKYSCNIFDGDDLYIHRICNAKGSINGGTEVNLLIKLPSKLCPQISIKKIHPETMETEWERFVNVKQSDIFGNHAITFITPRYDNPQANNEANNGHDIKVKISVVIRNSTYRSNSVDFYYVRENRKRPYSVVDNEPSTDNTRPNIISRDNVVSKQLERLHIDKKVTVQNGIDKINDMVAKGEETVLDNSAIFNALDSIDDLIYLYKLCKKKPEFCKFVANARHNNNENLLHVACKETNPQFIKPLIGLGCSLNAQDSMGRTPLHIAISGDNDQIISTIEKYLQNLSQYPESVKESFIKMLQAYDDNGYTVLHTAALKGKIELFENLLKFCVDNKINVLDYGTLQTGDSIGHLAVKYDLEPIMNILKKYVKNFEDVKNYEGKTVKDYLLDKTHNQTDDK
uniref:Sarcophaga-derived Rel/Ankyrin molecule n=1 Tax=Sarcophaga peregrina TaxID=7386 RepID=Q9NDR4_SARPE|nr:sarcophaga-derived Rel/Ankyrin molecule [Sarcophaga peregrina]